MMRHDAPDVRLVHLKEYATRGQQSPRRFMIRNVPLFGDGIEHSTRHFGMRNRPRYLNRYVLTQPLGYQDRRAGNVPIYVERDLLIQDTATDRRKALSRSSKILRHRTLV